MRRYRIFAGSDGTEEPKNEGGAPSVEAPKETPPSGPSEAEKLLMTEVAELKNRGKEMETLLLDETYAEFLASKKGADAQDADVKLDEMTNSELVVHLTKTLGDKLDSGLSRLESNSALTATKLEMKELRGKHDDFDLYKEEMIEIAKDNPNLSLKRMYRMAKAEAGPRKPKIGSGSLPNNEIPGEAPKTPAGFKDQFDAAWKKSGLKEILKEV